MEFWEMVYTLGWIEIELLGQAVITKSNPFGDITPEQFKEITGVKFAA